MPRKSPERIVLDAWAMLAMLFKEEPAAAQVSMLFEGPAVSPMDIHMSWINMGEVYYRLAFKRGRSEADSVLSYMLLLPIKLHEPSQKDILNAAIFKSKYRLSYADAFAVALADEIDAIIWTGDPEIIALEEVCK